MLAGELLKPSQTDRGRDSRPIEGRKVDDAQKQAMEGGGSETCFIRRWTIGMRIPGSRRDPGTSEYRQVSATMPPQYRYAAGTSLSIDKLQWTIQRLQAAGPLELSGKSGVCSAVVRRFRMRRGPFRVTGKYGVAYSLPCKDPDENQ
ncbi:hypothetical protein CCMA1212_005152 [Trichoderma ghanense]|uniref:Uncharacterized protein n=1 Tax=Trichoderma ghanense TaxID=65468 RepID=A0ABY2H3W8_9HYPO